MLVCVCYFRRYEPRGGKEDHAAGHERLPCTHGYCAEKCGGLGGELHWCVCVHILTMNRPTICQFDYILDHISMYK